MQHAVSLGASWICKGLRLALEPEADPRQRIILSGHQISLEKNSGNSIMVCPASRTAFDVRVVFESPCYFRRVAT